MSPFARLPMRLPMPLLTRVRAHRALLSAALLAGGLSGCGPQDPNAFAPECVPVGILAEAADLDSYAGDTHDLSTLVNHVGIAGVGGSCSDAKEGHALHTNISVVITLQRGPAALTRDVDVPYFIAVLHGGEVVAKHSLTLAAHFPPNTDRLALKSDTLSFELPISRRMSSESYRLEVGLQLTPEQLAFNRQHMPH